MAHGWYIVCYGLAIYLLNLLVQFLSPKIEPSLMDDAAAEDPGALPLKQSDEFRPFIRRLSEFKFWQQAQYATLVSLGMTGFQAFNLPVFWPILVIYFFILFGVTMKQRILHMIKYKYVPFYLALLTYTHFLFVSPLNPPPPVLIIIITNNNITIMKIFKEHFKTLHTTINKNTKQIQ